MNDVANPTTPKDAMKMVFPVIGIASVPTLSQTMKLPPVVPAPGFLTDISTDRALVAKLRAGHLRGTLCESWITFLDDLVVGHFADGRECSDPQSSFFCYPYPLEVL